MFNAKKVNDEKGVLVIAQNRKARYDFEILNTYECGLVLVGTEVKSLRARHVNFADSYALLKDYEIYLIGLKIEPYKQGTHENHELDRTRKLMLHKKEIKKIFKETKEKGSTLIPLKIYFKRGKAKVLLGLAKGKNKSDKRRTIKDREGKRELARVLKRG